MTDAPAPAASPVAASRPARRGARLGAWALVVTLFPVLYAAVGLVLLAFGRGATGVPGLAEIAYVMFFLGFLVVPVSLLVGLVLAILALALSRTLGKVLGALALVLIIAGIVALSVFLTGSDSPLFWT
ncbi:MAG: hypothetical protein ACKVOG_11695 [Rhodoglobus sp.]